jgi:protoporphyrin/coproporphyrin ferrochelatase
MRRFVIQLAAFVWIGVGIMLTRTGAKMLMAAYQESPERWWPVAVAVAVGVFIGYFKGKLVLSKSAMRNKRRISKLPNPVRPWMIFSSTFYYLIFLMMGMGRLLRWWAESGGTPRLFVGGLYCGIGGALFFSAFAYWFEKFFEPPNPWLDEPAPIITGKVGILLANLGTPTSPTPVAVGSFLKQFLSDPRVIEVPKAVWVIVLNLFIVPYRSFGSAALYKRVFTEEGSPLLFIGRKQAAGLQQILGTDVVVRLGMRYGEPSIKRAMAELKSEGCDRILVLPAYPQYSGTTSASMYDACYAAAAAYRMVPALRFAAPFPDDPGYIEALATRFKEATMGFDFEHVIFSYHSIPIAYAKRGDPYATQCVWTSRALVKALDLEQGHWNHCYQSIFGLDPWLGPQTDEVLKKLADQGVKKVAVICPGFLVDCLETIDEIGDVSTGLFLKAGGQELRLVPCLNDHPQWLRAMAAIVERETQGWREPKRSLEVVCRESQMSH